MSHQINKSAVKINQSSLPLKENGSGFNNATDKELLRFSIAGSFGDGKKTLSAQLLKRSFSGSTDQFLKDSGGSGVAKVNITLITGEQQSEQQQGIVTGGTTHFFVSSKRRFFLEEAPGQIGSAGDMVTVVRSSDVFVILIDARNGIVAQTRRHLQIASLLQITNVIIAINKIDLVNFSAEVYTVIKQEVEQIASVLKLRNTWVIPISATDGDNLAEVSAKTPWYIGETLSDLLDTIPVTHDEHTFPDRFPVQNVSVPVTFNNHHYTGFEGHVAGGVFRVGDTILILPSNRLSTIKAIDDRGAELSEAFTSQQVTLRLDGNITISRGDLFVKLNVKYPHYSSVISLKVYWLNANPLSAGAKYIVRHATGETEAKIEYIRYKVNFDTLENIKADQGVLLNDIAHITIKTQKPLKYDDYSENRITGSLLFIDSATLETVGAGMIISDPEVYSYNI